MLAVLIASPFAYAIRALRAAGLDSYADRMERNGTRTAVRAAGERAAHLADSTGLAKCATAYQVVLRLAKSKHHGLELRRAVTKDREGKARRGWVPKVSTDEAKTPAASGVVTADTTKPRGIVARLASPLPNPGK